MSIAKNGGTRLTIRMTDRDVIERVNALFPCTKIQVVRFQNERWKTQYGWRISEPDTVRQILTLLLPWFGERRAARAREVLAHLDSRVSSHGWHHGSKTHCAQGHPYSPENTYLRPGTTHRHCRTCRTEWARQYRERKQAAA